MGRKRVATQTQTSTGVSDADLDKAKARVAELRSKVEQATQEWETAQADLKTKAKQFLADYGLSDMFGATPAKTSKGKNGEAKGERWRASHVLALINERSEGWSEQELRGEMSKRKPAAKQDKLADYLKEFASEKGGRYSLNAKGKAQLK